jgi:hypothetical protein
MKRLVFCLLIILVAGTSCRNPLTRDLALSKLKESPGYPVMKSYKILKSYTKDMDTQGRGVSFIIGEDDNKEKETILRQFESEGLLHLTETPQYSESNSFLFGTTTRTWTLVEIKLTDSGRKYLISEDNICYSVKIWETGIHEVTGILEAEDRRTAQVEYTLSNQDITPFGECFSDKTQVINKTAFFAKYDDGWRIQE